MKAIWRKPLGTMKVDGTSGRLYMNTLARSGLFRSKKGSDRIVLSCDSRSQSDWRSQVEQSLRCKMPLKSFSAKSRLGSGLTEALRQPQPGIEWSLLEIRALIPSAVSTCCCRVHMS